MSWIAVHDQAIEGVANYADISSDTSMVVTGYTFDDVEGHKKLSTPGGTPIAFGIAVYDIGFTTNTVPGQPAPYLNKTQVMVVKTTETNYNDPAAENIFGFYNLDVLTNALPTVHSFRLDLETHPEVLPGDTFYLVFFGGSVGTGEYSAVNYTSVSFASVTQNPDTWTSEALGLSLPLLIEPADGNIPISDTITAGSTYRYLITVSNPDLGQSKTLQVNSMRQVLPAGPDVQLGGVDWTIAPNSTQTFSVTSVVNDYGEDVYLALNGASDLITMTLTAFSVESLTSDGGETITPISVTEAYSITNYELKDAELLKNGIDPIVLSPTTGYRMTVLAICPENATETLNTDLFISDSPNGTRLWESRISVVPFDEYEIWGADNFPPQELNFSFDAPAGNYYLYLDAGIDGNNFNRSVGYSLITLIEKSPSPSEIILEFAALYKAEIYAVKNNDSKDVPTCRADVFSTEIIASALNIPIRESQGSSKYIFEFTTTTANNKLRLYPSLSDETLNSVDFSMMKVSYLYEAPEPSNEMKISVYPSAHILDPQVVEEEVHIRVITFGKEAIVYENQI